MRGVNGVFERSIFITLLSGLFLSFGFLSCSDDDDNQIKLSQLWGSWNYEGKKKVEINLSEGIPDEKKEVLIKYLENSDYEPYIEKAMYILNENGTFDIMRDGQALRSGLVYSYSEADKKLSIFQSINATEPYISYDVVTISGNYALLKYTIDLNNIYWDTLEKRESITSASAFVELTRVDK